MKEKNRVVSEVENILFSFIVGGVFCFVCKRLDNSLEFAHVLILVFASYFLKKLLNEIINDTTLNEDNILWDDIHNQVKYITSLLKNRKFSMGVLIIITLVFGYYLTSFSISLDEEFQFYNPKNTGQWCYEGRFIIATIKELLMKNGMYPPIFVAIISVITYSLSGIVDIAAFNKAQELNEDNRNVAAELIFLVGYLSFPAVVFEFMSFNTYSFDVSCGILFASISVFELICFFDDGKKYEVVLSIIFLMLGIGVYQAIINVYISLVAIYFFLRILNQGQNNLIRKNVKKIVISICVMVIALGIFYILYLIATTIHSNQGSQAYVNSYSNWDLGLGIIGSLKKSLKALFMTITTPGTLFNKYFMFMAIVAAGNEILLLLFERKWKRIVLSLLNIFVTFSCFVLWIVLASTYLPYRTMLAVPLVAGIICYIFIILQKRYMAKYQLINIGCIFFISLLLIREVQTLNIMFYYDDIRAKKDVRFAEDIYTDVNRIVGDRINDEPIIFIGVRDLTSENWIYNSPSNGSYWGGNAYGYSIWRRAQEPMRIMGLYGVLGYEVECEVCEDENIIDFLNAVLTVYPEEGSICEVDGKIYVKLQELSDGWKESDVGMMYYINGKPVQRWRNIDGKRYYFDPVSCVMVTGKIIIGGEEFIFDDDGHLIEE